MIAVNVSVIIPTHNRPDFLARAIDSVLRQTIRPAEILVVNDSNDPIRNERYRRIGKHPPIRVLPNLRTKGASGARNEGSLASKCDVLAFLDDDDEWLPTFLEHSYEVMKRDSLDVTCSGFIERRDNGACIPEKTAPRSLTPEAFYLGNPGLRGSNLMINATVFRSVLFDEALPSMNDLDFGIRLSEQKPKYDPISKRLVVFHQHNEPRLSTPRCRAKMLGVRRFYQLYGSRMSPAQKEAFSLASIRRWGVDQYGTPM